MGKTKKYIKRTRKVIVLKHSILKESIIVTKTINNVKYNKKIKKTANQFIGKQRYPSGKEHLKKRIVPCCFREKCHRNKTNKRVIQQEKYKNSRTKHYPRQNTNEISMSPLSSEISEIFNETNNLRYENISSGSLNLSSDDDIETLLTSTRKRMKDLNNDWKLLPRLNSSSISNNSQNMNMSINSLDTLIIEEEELNECSEKNYLKENIYSSNMNPDKVIKQEPIDDNNNNNSVKLEHSTVVYYHKPNVYDGKPLKRYFDNEIHSTITKLENSDVDYIIPNINMCNINIKQDPYDDEQIDYIQFK